MQGTTDYEMDRFEHSTAVCALIHYSLHVAAPSGVIRTLKTLCPNPSRPWEEIISEARDEHRNLLTTHHRMEGSP